MDSECLRYHGDQVKYGKTITWAGAEPCRGVLAAILIAEFAQSKLDRQSVPQLLLSNIQIGK